MRLNKGAAAKGGCLLMCLNKGAVAPSEEKEEGQERLSAPARFTVEMSLLMLLIIPFLVALIICGFYIHDRAYLQAAACETAAMGSALEVYDDKASLIARNASRRLDHAMTWSRQASAQTACSDDNVSVTCSGSFSVPSLAAKMLFGGTVTLQGKWERSVYHPAPLIWKVRSAKFLLDSALGG